MKFNKWTLGLAAIALMLASPSHAQNTVTTGANGVVTTTTNNPTPPAQFVSPQLALETLLSSATTISNWVADVGYGHSVSGVGRNLAFVTLEYDFDNYAGLMVGYDYLWGNGGHELNALKGGMTLKMPLTPFASLGYTNITATPFAFDLITTPSGGSTVGNVVGGGIDFKLTSIGKVNIHAGGEYESRSGEGAFDGNYIAGYIAATTSF